MLRLRLRATTCGIYLRWTISFSSRRTRHKMRAVIFLRLDLYVALPIERHSRGMCGPATPWARARRGWDVGQGLPTGDRCIGKDKTRWRRRAWRRDGAPARQLYPSSRSLGRSFLEHTASHVFLMSVVGVVFSTSTLGSRMAVYQRSGTTWMFPFRGLPLVMPESL